MEERTSIQTSYKLRGEQLEIDYSPELLTVRDAQGERSFAAAEVESEPSRIGTLITVTLEAIPDAETVTVSVVLPEVNFPADSPEAAVTAVAIRTLHAGSIGGPSLVQGALQGYTVVQLQGLATGGDAPGQAECRNWVAWRNLEPPGPAQLVVTAECTVPSGYTVSLMRHEPPGTNPRDLLLDQVVHAPADPPAAGQTQVAARYEEETDVEYDTVTILPGGPSIPVDEAR
jgi:hypothetical protein